MSIAKPALVVLSGLVVTAMAAPPDAPPPSTARRSLVIPTASGGAIAAPVAVVVPVQALAFGADGFTLAAGGYGEVVIWDLRQARLAKRLGAGRLVGLVRAIAMTPDGGRLAVATGDPGAPATVEVLETGDGRVVASCQGPKDEVLALAWSADAKWLAAGSADALAYVWGPEGGEPAAKLEGHAGWVTDVAFAADGSFLATSGTDRSVRLWTPVAWKAGPSFPQPGPAHALAFNTNGGLLAIGTDDEEARGVTIRPRATTAPARPNAKGEPPASPPPPYAGAGRTIDTAAGGPLDLAWSSRGMRLYSACDDGTVRVLAPDRGTLLKTVVAHAGGVNCVAVAPDATKYATGGDDGTVRLWDAGRDAPIATLVQLAPGTDRWLIVAATGALDSSQPDAVRRPDGDGSAPAADPEGLRAALMAPTTAPIELRTPAKGTRQLQRKGQRP